MEFKKLPYYIIYLVGYILLGLAAPFIYIGVIASLFGVMGHSSFDEKLAGIAILAFYFLAVAAVTKIALKKLKVGEIVAIFIAGVLLVLILLGGYWLNWTSKDQKNIHPNKRKWEEIIINTRDSLAKDNSHKKYWFNTGGSTNFTETANNKDFNNKVKVCFVFWVNNIEKTGRSDCDFLIKRLPDTGFEYIIIIEQEYSNSNPSNRAVYARYTTTKVLKDYGIIDTWNKEGKLQELNKVVIKP